MSNPKPIEPLTPEDFSFKNLSTPMTPERLAGLKQRRHGLSLFWSQQVGELISTIEVRDKRIEELERENAELKKAAGQALLYAMQEYSERDWACEWYSGFEFSLWKHIQECKGDDEYQKMANLRDLAGGWWTFGEEDIEPRFVTSEEFENMYFSRVQS